MTSLHNRLVLHHFACMRFGYRDLNAMLECLSDIPAKFDVNQESEYARALLNSREGVIDADHFVQYDANIIRHSHQLNMAGEDGRVWKPHQYVALLFTEWYLHYYFDDSGAFCAELNDAKSQYSQATRAMKNYLPDDLRTLAFQSATGSGKTLIMHAHILQYRHYLDLSGGRLNNVVLLTPNEQMSDQHQRDLRKSGLNARLFSADAVGDVSAPIEIVDINKLG